MDLITQKLNTIVGATNPDPIHSRRKAITVFLPYAAWQGQNEILDIFLQTARTSMPWGFVRRWIGPLVTILLNQENPVSLKQAAILASPHLPWWNFTNIKHLIQLWALAASAIPYTEKIGQSVVDTLLQIASHSSLQPHIPIEMWLWLNKCPTLPPICTGRYLGSARDVIQTVRGLRDIRTLTSYLLLIWSEWDEVFFGLEEMCVTIREDFRGTRTHYYRKSLLQRLDHILGQLDLGLGHLQQYKPTLSSSGIGRMKERYQKLKEVLLEVDREGVCTLICEFLRSGILHYLLIPGRPRIPPSCHVCNSSPMFVIVYLTRRLVQSQYRSRICWDLIYHSYLKLDMTQRDCDAPYIYCHTGYFVGFIKFLGPMEQSGGWLPL